LAAPTPGNPQVNSSLRKKPTLKPSFYHFCLKPVKKEDNEDILIPNGGFIKKLFSFLLFLVDKPKAFSYIYSYEFFFLSGFDLLVDDPGMGEEANSRWPLN
jgi:hypothetical protein